MLKVIASNVVISKGYKDKPALRFSEGDKAVLFRIGKRVYDPRAEDNYRWININVKAFGELVERIRKMKLDAGSFINIDGRYDEDTWPDPDDESKTLRAPCIILADLEYAYTGNGGNKDSSATNSTSAAPSATQGSQPSAPTPEDPSEMPEGFTGYENYGEEDSLFPDNPFTQR